MKKIFRYLPLLLLCIQAYAIHAQSGVQPQILGKARALGNTLAVRWAPGDYDTWRQGMEDGYVVSVLRYRDSLVLPTGIVAIDTIFPSPQGTWGGAGADDYERLGHELLYNFSTTYTGAEGAFQQAEDRETRFGFMLFAADMSPEAARHMGLSLTLANIDPSYKYIISVQLAGSNLLSPAIEVDPANQPPLPSPDSLSVQFGHKEFTLAWYKAELEQHYTSYDIEYSDDGGQSFRAYNEQPFVFLETDDQDGPAQDFMFYSDTIRHEVEEYQFRIRGRSPFGEQGPYSEVVSGRSRPVPLPLLTTLQEVTELADSTFRITWTVTDAYSDQIIGFRASRYDAIPGEPTLLHTDTLPPGTRSFVHTLPSDINYYQVEALDSNGFSYPSNIALGQRLDSIPPLAPTGLTAVLDSISDSLNVVRLSWMPNAEADLAGYHVWVSNGLDVEFALLTSARAIADTFYLDTIPAQSLSEQIYYTLQAVDFNGNTSAFTDTLAVERPDLLPPTPPVLLVNRSDPGGTLTWVNSSSTDVVSYQVQRMREGGAEWEVVEEKAKNRATTDQALQAIEPEREQAWLYRVVAFDDAGYQTPSEAVRIIAPPTQKAYEGAVAFRFEVAASGRSNRISWTNDFLHPVQELVIYKRINGGPMRAVAFTNPVNGYYDDPYVEEGNAYAYFLQLRYTNGETSNLSPKRAISR